MSNSIFERIVSFVGSVGVHTNGNGATTSQRKAAIHRVEKGIAAYNTRKYNEAETLFRQAIEQDPGYSRAHCYLGNALHKLGAPEEAVIEWKKAVIVDPDSEAAAKAQAKLNKVTAHNTAVARSLEESLGMRNERH